MERVSQAAMFGGQQMVFEHASSSLQCNMRFGLYEPPAEKKQDAPALLWLSGLTATEQNFITKAGAQRKASELGVYLVCCDTSPRGEHVANDDAYDLGQGAGFYLDATEEPWRKHFNMQTYLTTELVSAVRELTSGAGRIGIFGHSMGGHGALTLHLKFPEVFASCSAFAPISSPMQCPWGEKAFSAYLGDDRQLWQQHDANELIKAGRKATGPILVDQGLADEFLEGQLKPEIFEATCAAARQPSQMRRHAGYDHSYYFIASFVDDHIAFHYDRLSE